MYKKIAFINDECVFYNNDFWNKNHDELIININDEKINFSIKDFFENEITDVGDIITEIDSMYYLSESLKESKDKLAAEIKYNIDVGKEFIALFREEFVRTPLKEMTSLEIAQKTANLIPLILTGSFREACDLLRLYEPDEFMTRERIDKYIAMLTSADAIDYNYEKTNTEESITDV